MKKTIFISIFCIILGIVTFLVISKLNQAKPINAISAVNKIESISKEDLIKAAKNNTYIIEDQAVTLVDGKSEIEGDGGGSKTITNYFGNEAVGDFNSDGRNDIAFLVTQNGGGSGTFYYVVITLNTPDGFAGTNGYLIGDRIAPQTTEVDSNNILVVNFADRKEDESFGEQPSMAKTLRLKFDIEKLKLNVIK